MWWFSFFDVQGFEPAERENQAEGHVDGPREKKGSGAARRRDLFTLFDLYHEMPDENNTDEKKHKEWHDKARRFLTKLNIIPAPRLHEENSKPEKEEEEEEEEEKPAIP